jgi:hypothetical protein
LRRRLVLLGGVCAGLAGCVRIPARDESSDAPATSSETNAWQASALAILGDALATLRTFEDFAAYRVSMTPDSGQRPQASLLWDPPTGAAWDTATRVSRELHDRANQLFQAIATTQIDSSLWRTQKDMADASHDLIDLGDALRAYRDRIDRTAPGDAGGALDLLNAAWTQFDAVAARWGTARSEAVACATHA